MIAAEFDRSGDGRLAFRIAGHSTYARRGNDIVCAAVSAIVCALVGFLSKQKSEQLRLICFESGHVELDCSEECGEAVMMACIGLTQLAMSYPEQIKLKNRAFFRQSDVDTAV